MSCARVCAHTHAHTYARSCVIPPLLRPACARTLVNIAWRRTEPRRLPCLVRLVRMPARVHTHTHVHTHARMLTTPAQSQQLARQERTIGDTDTGSLSSGWVGDARARTSVGPAPSVDTHTHVHTRTQTRSPPRPLLRSDPASRAVEELLARVRDSPLGVTPDDVGRVLDAVIACGRARAGLDLLAVLTHATSFSDTVHGEELGEYAAQAQQVSDSAETATEAPRTRRLVTPAHVQKLLTAAAFQHDARLADDIVALCLRVPSSCLSASVLDTYASSIATAHLTHSLSHAHAHAKAAVADVSEEALEAVIVRGLSFCAFILDSAGHDAFAAFTHAFTRVHGLRGADAVFRVVEQTFRASNQANDDVRRGAAAEDGAEGSSVMWSFRACVCMCKALTTAGSPRAMDMYPIMMKAAVGSNTAPGLRLNGYAHDSALGRAVCEAVHTHVCAQLRFDQRAAAADTVMAAAEEHPGLRFGDTSFKVCKALAQSLSSTRAAGASVSDRVCVSTHTHSMLATFRMALRAQAVMPNLVERVLSALITHSRLDEAYSVLDELLSDRSLRSLVRSDRHCNPLLDALLKAGDDARADTIFKVRASTHRERPAPCSAPPPRVQRMLATDASRFPLLVPNAKTYNMFVLRAARRGDKLEARRLMTIMSDRGVAADAYTVSAVALLRSPRMSGVVTSEPSPALLQQDEADADMMLARMLDNSGKLVRAGTGAVGATGPFNQVMQAYFRVGQPGKAVSVLDAMHSIGAAPGADTIRLLLMGLSLTGGQDAHGVPSTQLPVSWGGGKPDAVYSAERAAWAAQRKALGEDTLIDTHAAGNAVAAQPQRDAALRCAPLRSVIAALNSNKLTATHATSADPLDAQLLRQWEPLHADAPERVQQLAKMRALFPTDIPSSSGADWLACMPLLFEKLGRMGVTAERVGRCADPVLSWASGMVSPRRQLQLFLTMYACGLWDATLCRTQRAQLLFPGLLVFDVRGAYIPSAMAFLHVLLSAIQRDWRASGRRAAWFQQDVVITAGAADTSLSKACAAALCEDVQPPLRAHATPKALILRKHELAAWAHKVSKA